MDLQTLKNTYAQDKGYEDWDDLWYAHIHKLLDFEIVMDDICLRAQKAALENAAENAVTTIEEYYVGEVAGHIGMMADRVIIDRCSITNEQNLIR